MKSKEELNALKEEVETVSRKLSALTEEELEQVTGGTAEWVQVLVELIGPDVFDWINQYGYSYVKNRAREMFGDTWYVNAIPAD